MVNNGGFMKIKRVKNKIGFFIWAIIGFCLVMLLYKIGANAEERDIFYTQSITFTTAADDKPISVNFNPITGLTNGDTYYYEVIVSPMCGRYGNGLYTLNFPNVSISETYGSACYTEKIITGSFVWSDGGSAWNNTPKNGFRNIFIDSSYGDISISLTIYKLSDTPPTPTKTLTDISVNKTKITYFVGEEFSINDISVDALYSDLSSENVTNFTVDYSSVNINVAGTYQISITYEGITKTIPIVYDSIPVTLTSISAVKSKTNYYVGDTLNTNDFVVTGLWSDGTETVLSDYTVNISSVHMNTVGSYPITVSYEDKTTTVYITVNAVEEPPVEPPLGDLTTTNALLQKLDIDINNNLYEVRLLCGFNVALLIASIFLRRKS